MAHVIRTTADERAQVAAELTADDGPFAIADEVVHGVLLRVYRGAPLTMRDIFADSGRHGSLDAVVYDDERYTFADQVDIVARLAHVLGDEYGVGKGDRVVLMMRNYPEWLFAFWATTVLGAIVVPLNSWWTAQEAAYALGNCEPVVALGDTARVRAIQEVRSRVPSLKSVVEVRAEGGLIGDVAYEALLGRAPAGLELPEVEIAPDDDLTIMYTSGTTGTPKGVVATHRSHVHGVWNLRLNAAVDGRLNPQPASSAKSPEQPGVPVTFPLFHIAGMGMVKTSAATGSKLVLLYKWDAVKVVELVERERLTSVAGVPTMLSELLDVAAQPGRDLSSLRAFSSGGAQVSSQIIGRIGSIFGGRVGVGTGYGMTETTGSMVMTDTRAMFERPLAVGHPLPVSDIRLVGQDGRDVADGDIGEVWFRGPNVARGLWNQQSETHLPDGWLRSGDLGRIDEAGYLYVVDRIKDVIVRGGENVYCAEVEDVLLEHPAVVEAAVLGLPEERLGEQVCAVVRVAPGAVVAVEELRASVAARLAHFKVPSRIDIREQELPRNAVGKILKRQLQQELIAQATA